MRTALCVLALTACSSGSPPLASSPAVEPASSPVAEPDRSPAPAPAAKVPAGPGGAMAGMLEAHNRLRARHCVPPLVWSAELADDAQAWSDHIVGNGCRLEHAPRIPEGENLAWVAPVGVADAAGIVQRWYDEIADYDFGAGGFSMQTGHFTQLVWASTREVGCGVGVCNGGNLWVCRYSPPGNVQGEYGAEVKAPCE